MAAKDRKAYIRDLEADLNRTRESLRPLESGEMHIQQRRQGQPWRDITAEVIATHKRNVMMLESIIAALSKGEVP